jgi:hypothetical protein
MRCCINQGAKKMQTIREVLQSMEAEVSTGGSVTRVMCGGHIVNLVALSYARLPGRVTNDRVVSRIWYVNGKRVAAAKVASALMQPVPEENQQ